MSSVRQAAKSSVFLQVWWQARAVGARCVNAEKNELLSESSRQRKIGLNSIQCRRLSGLIGIELGNQLRMRKVDEVYLYPMEPNGPGRNMGLFNHLLDVCMGLKTTGVETTIDTMELLDSVHIADHPGLGRRLEILRRAGIQVTGPKLYYPATYEFE